MSAPINGTGARTRGRSVAEAARLLKLKHPDKAELIDAYGARFDEMMAGPIVGPVEILAELHEPGTPLYGLSNFSAETFPPAFERFEFLRWFRGMVISGEVAGNLSPLRYRPTVITVGSADKGQALRDRADLDRLDFRDITPPTRPRTQLPGGTLRSNTVRSFALSSTTTNRTVSGLTFPTPMPKAPPCPASTLN